jgi:Methyltransferase domain
MPDSNDFVYVQYGCGPSAGEGWLNFDSSLTLRIERIPVIGALVSRRFSGNTWRFPPSVQYGDICKLLPVTEGTARGVYASHVLEHLSLDDCRQALVNTFKMLAPGGTFRLIVPDLEERANRYVERAATGTPDAAGRFLDSSGLGQEHRPRTPLQHIRQMMGGSKHLWMWDEYSMADELRKVNFVNIRRCEFGDSTDPMFSRVEQQGRFFDEELGIRECALEARKPV